MNDELRDLNGMARRLLVYLHSWAVKGGGRPFSISPHDPATLSATELDSEAYMKAAWWLVRKHLAEWFASGGSLTITEYGIQVAGDDSLLDNELPTAAETPSRLRTNGVMGPSGNGDEIMPSTGPKIFISHAGGDARIAKALIDLIEAGLEVPTGTIRCTSVDGYKLDGGDDAPEVLRENLKVCSVVLGMLTKTSISSSYVLMELGAAWAFKKRAIPLIGPGATFGDLPGPFRDIHALRMAHEPDMSGLIKTLAKETGFTETNNFPKIIATLKALTETMVLSGALGVSPSAPFRS